MTTFLHSTCGKGALFQVLFKYKNDTLCVVNLKAHTAAKKKEEVTEEFRPKHRNVFKFGMFSVINTLIMKETNLEFRL